MQTWTGVGWVCRWLPWSLALAGLALTPARAAGQQTDSGSNALEGVIVRVDSGELILDLGHANGLPEQAELDVFRRVEVVHPVTGEQLVDRFPIGQLPVSETGHLLSIARDVGALERPPQVGDYVVYRRPSADGEAVRAEGGPVAPAAEPSADTASLAFERTLGRPLDERIAIWTTYLRTHPDSPYTERVGAELDWLRQRLAEEHGAVAAVVSVPHSDRLQGFVSAPSEVTVGQSVPIAAAIVERERVEYVRVLVRREGEPGFEPIALQADGDYNWRVDLEPAGAETLEWFLEVIETDGTQELLAGSASNPLHIRSSAPVDTTISRRDRSTALVALDFVDFNSGAPVDQYLRFETAYRYGLDVWQLSAVTVGAGIFQGEGASASVLASGGDTEQRVIGYGFAEIELTLRPRLATSWRFLAGNSRREGARESLEGVFGHQLSMRIGEPDGTRLELGGALTDEIGNEAWTELILELVERVPMWASVVVTNLPVGEELGVSLNYGIGFRATEALTLVARTGLNARTVDDFGFTGGFGTVLTW